MAMNKQVTEGGAPGSRSDGGPRTSRGDDAGQEERMGPPATTRAQHLAWCKQRALEYVTDGDWVAGMASMASDMAKHPETHALVSLMALGIATTRSPAEARRFIEGFN